MRTGLGPSTFDNRCLHASNRKGPCRVVLNQFDWISRVSFAVGDDFESGFHDRRRERPNLGTFLASELFNRPSASLCNELVEVPQACIGIS